VARRKRMRAVGPTGKYQEWDGTYEILIDTPVGPQWQAESAPRPDPASHWSAGYSPTGRQVGVPASYRTPIPTSQEEDLFGAEFGSVLGEALKGKQGLVGGGGGQGGGTRQYDIASMTAGMSKYPSLYLRKQRYP
jgi:hypothetical protein